MMRKAVANSVWVVALLSFFLLLSIGYSKGYPWVQISPAIGADFPSFWAHVPLLDFSMGLLRQLPGGCYETLEEPFVLTGEAVCIFR